MFKPKHLKQAKLLRKGVKKFLHYKRDLISEEKMEAIQGALDEFDEAVEAKSKEKIEKAAKRLTGTCEKAVPAASNASLRENLEVIFVAVVIAVGIRAYVLQPFKIPTGSMQPTLNGIIAYNLDEDQYEQKKPGAVGKAFELGFAGRKYLNEVMEEDKTLTAVETGTFLKFFPYTKLFFQDGSVMKLKIPLQTLTNEKEEGGTGFGFHEWFKPSPRSGTRVGGLGRAGTRYRAPGTVIPKGTVIARGYVDTGDQVLVDKISYHFRKPNRGEVFVFSTKNIDGIIIDPPEQGSQHYIKRLVGVPGDRLELRATDEPERRALGGGDLFINDARATEPGMVRVMDEYPKSHPATHSRGYVYGSMGGGRVITSFDLTDEDDPRYVAMGDNSGNSADSRSWGTVPQENLVGPALVVYWPFAHHWGFIR